MHFKVYKLRHQADGVIQSKVYASPPGDQEIANVLAKLDRKYGTHHAKTSARLFLTVVEEIVESDADMPGFAKADPPKPPMAEFLTLTDHEGNAFHVHPSSLAEQLSGYEDRLGGDVGAARAGRPKFEGVGTVTNPPSETFEIGSDDIGTLKT